MSSETSSKRVCLLCLRIFNSSADNPVVSYEARLMSLTSGLKSDPSESQKEGFMPGSGGRCDIYTKFLHFSSRYLKLPTTTEVFLNARKNHEPVQAFCADCQQVVTFTCDLYAELQVIKLHLLWKLSQIDKTMRKANNTVSRKLYRGLMKTLTTQLNMHCSTRVDDFRKMFLVKCKAKFKECTPKLLVPTGLFPEEWKFGYAACKLSLMKLIVVFLLASSKVYTNMEKDDNEAVSHLKQPRRRRGRPRKNGTNSINCENTNSSSTIVANVERKDAEVMDESNMKLDLKIEDMEVGETFSDHDFLADLQSDNEFSADLQSDNDSLNIGPDTGSEIEFQPNCQIKSSEQKPLQKRWNLRSNRRPAVVLSEHDTDNSDSDQESGTAEKDERDLAPSTKPMKNRRGFPRIGDCEPSVKCPKCKKMFLDNRSLAGHLIAKHGTRLTYSCITCGMKFVRWKDLRNHKRAMHRKATTDRRWSRSPKETKCPICLKVFHSALAFLIHRRDVHNKGKRGPKIKEKVKLNLTSLIKIKSAGRPSLPAKCPICDQIFPNKKALLQHRRQEHKKKVGRRRVGRPAKREKKCVKCNEVFSSIKELSEHCQQNHPKSDRGRPARGETKCTKCDKAFPSGKEMIEHRRKEHPKVRGSVPGETKEKNKSVAGSKKCRKCEEIFSSYDELITHRKNSHKVIRTKHECPICFRTVISDDRLSKHLQAHEKNELRNVELWYCEVCGQHYYKEESLQQHMVQVHNNVYTCSICKAEMQSGKLLRDHLVTHEKTEKYFHCMICFRGFSSQQYYDIHRKLAHKDQRRFHCDYDMCNEMFDSVELLNDHLMVHAEEAKQRGDSEWSHVNKCKICGKGFIKSYNFTMHELTHTPHNVGRPGYDCPVGDCGQTVRYLGTLLTHYNRVHGLGIMPIKCHTCSKAFSSIEWYRYHIRNCGEQRERTDEDEQRFCRVCGEKFPNKTSLIKHKKEKHNHKTIGRHATTLITCPEPDCGEILTPGLINYHLVRAHGKGVKKFPCEICGKLFIDAGHVKDHMIVHSAPRHMCDICGVRFKKPFQVRKHKAEQHTENREKAYTCDMCGLSYYTKQGLKYHHWSLHAQSNELRHSCPHCKKRYGRKMLLTVHMKTCEKQHGNQVDDVDDDDEREMSKGTAGVKRNLRSSLVDMITLGVPSKQQEQHGGHQEEQEQTREASIPETIIDASTLVTSTGIQCSTLASIVDRNYFLTPVVDRNHQRPLVQTSVIYPHQQPQVTPSTTSSPYQQRMIPTLTAVNNQSVVMVSPTVNNHSEQH